MTDSGGTADGGSTPFAATLNFGDSWAGGIGDIAELLVFDNALSTADRNAVGVYLADKYGITTAYVVPEPGALALLSSGLIGLLAYAWRKRR